MMRNAADAADPNSLSHCFRVRRDRFLRAFILDQRRHITGPCRIIDLGGGAAYWQRVGYEWLRAHEVEVLCINHDGSELTRDSDAGAPVQLAVGDACNMAAFADNSFHIVHSNSVIEHVGRWPQMTDFAREVRRLAAAYYVQTPYFWFPVDPHFYRLPMLHWLPASLRLKIHRRYRVGWSGGQPDTMKAMGLVESNVMLDRAQFRALFPDAKHRFEYFAGLPKSMIATRGVS